MLLTMKEIANLLGTTYARVYVAGIKANIKPVDVDGRTLLFSPDDLPRFRDALTRKPNAQQAADPQAELPASEQDCIERGEAAIPSVS